MSTQLRRFREEVLMLVSVSVPLASTERNWWYVAGVIIGAAVGAWSHRFRSRPALSAAAGQILVLLAFVYLVIEVAGFPQTPTVLALSHFMIAACVSKWLTPRTARDDTMMWVLLLLLLVIAAIMGEVLFPLALTVYLSVGMRALVRQHLESEAVRAARHNRRLQDVNSAEDSVAPLPAIRGISGTAVSLSLAALLVGSIVFVATPRVGAGMFGPAPSAIASRAVSGLARTVDFNTAGAIAQSDRTVMRVIVTWESGDPVGAETPLYFRGAVLSRYGYRTSSWQSGWGWRRSESSEAGSSLHLLAPAPSAEFEASLLPEADGAELGSVLVQKYFLESADEMSLFACYPPLSISSRDNLTIRKNIDDQTLQLARPARRALQYAIRSPFLTSTVASALTSERGSDAPPAARPPDPPLTRQADILALIDERTAGVGPLDQKSNRLEFVRRLQDYLQSNAFTYTLSPPRVPDRTDPVSHFLLTSRRGHCEYFASALTLMCQLKGIPARLVTGYCSGDYNSLGDFYVVRQKHAHAWVEVFIPELDWMTFDPTPSGNRQGTGMSFWDLRLRRYVEYLQFNWMNMVLSFDATARQKLFDEFAAWLRRPAENERTAVGAVRAFVRELFGWRLVLTWKERLIYWVFAVLVVILAVLIGYVVVTVAVWSVVSGRRLYLHRRSRTVLDRESAFYHRFCRRLKALGLRRRPDQTPAEFAEQLASRFPALSEAPALIGAYYEVVFGGRPLAAPQRTHVEELLTRLSKLDRGQLGP